MAFVRDWSRNAGYLPLADVIKYFQSIYDKDGNGKVDDSEKVNGLTVFTAVPLNAVFTDTTYTIQDGELSQWNFTTAFRDKLNGIEVGATADQTGAEIKTLYEAESDTNAFTDALLIKLNAIEAGATADLTGPEIKALYEALADTNGYTDAEKAKVGFISITQTVDLDAIELRVNQLDAAVVLMGVWDASVGTFPTSTRPGESWIVSVAGTVDGIEFKANDRIISLVASASTTIYLNNWHKLDYTDQVVSVDGQTGAVNLSAVYETIDANIVRRNVATTFTASQRTSATAEDNNIDFTVTNDFTITLGASLTVTVGSITGCDGQSGVIVISDIQNVAGWSGFTWLGTVPTLSTGVGIFSYKIIGTTVYIVKVENV